jgi:hypothetical protein
VPRAAAEELAMALLSILRSPVRASILVGLALSSSACVQDQDFLIVERAVWFEADDDCVLSDATPTPLAMVVDVSFQTRIGMGFVLTNNTSPNPGSNTGIDDSDIAVESAEVKLSFSGGEVEGGSFEVTLPNNSLLGGTSEAFLVQIPTAVSDSLRAGVGVGEYETLEMEVVFKGRKFGQAGNSKLGEVESRAYVYPFEICNGCLVDCECGICPTSTEWVGVCGFAQGTQVISPSCDLVDEEDPTDTDGLP